MTTKDYYKMVDKFSDRPDQIHRQQTTVTVLI